MNNNHIDIIIVGAGPTGLLAANLLGQAGLSVLLIDKSKEPLNLPRAISIDDEGCRSIDMAGLGAELKSILKTSEGSRYLNEDGQIVGEVGPGPVEFGWPKRNIFHQPQLEALLTNGLKRFPKVHFERATELTNFHQNSEEVIAKISGYEVHCQILIAADGARSQTRELLGVKFPGEAYPQDWVVLDLHEDRDQEPVSKFFCDPKRPWVSIPTTYGGRRYEFMLLPGEDRQEILQHGRLKSLLRATRKLAPQDIMRAAVYTFEARVATTWGQGRVWLAGDAAHLTPPFAGQGMNAGLRDATNLAWKAALVVKGADPSLLKTYEAERKKPARDMVQLAVAMGEVVMPVGKSSIYRDALMAGLKRFPGARDFVLGMKFKPPPTYQTGVFIGLDDATQPPASLIGRMLPNPNIKDNGRIVFLDTLLGTNFTLIAQSEPGRSWLRELDENTWPIELEKVYLSDDTGAPDMKGYRPIRAHRDQVILLRPDRYVLGAFKPDEADKFLLNLRTLLFLKQ